MLCNKQLMLTFGSVMVDEAALPAKRACPCNDESKLSVIRMASWSRVREFNL